MKSNHRLLARLILCLLLGAIFLLLHHNTTSPSSGIFGTEAVEVVSGTDGDYIKWVDFNISYEALCAAYDLDVASYDAPIHLNWIELLAYAGAKNGGKFDKNSVSLIQKLASELSGEKTTIKELTEDMKYYEYYYEAYETVLGGMVGEYEIEQENEAGEKEWKKVYGLKAFSPIAKGFEYTDYDDFGSSRSYGYKRPHLGHDMMGQIGTPIGILNRIGITCFLFTVLVCCALYELGGFTLAAHFRFLNRFSYFQFLHLYVLTLYTT